MSDVTQDLTKSGAVILASLRLARETSPNFPWVSEPVLCEQTECLGPSVRKELWILRSMGFNVESAMWSDHTSFESGARGWRLIDDGVSQEIIDRIYEKVDVISDEPIVWRKGMRVYHPIFGRGKLLFAREGFDKVKVLYGTEEVKFSRDELSNRPFKMTG